MAGSAQRARDRRTQMCPASQEAAYVYSERTECVAIRGDDDRRGGSCLLRAGPAGAARRRRAKTLIGSAAAGAGGPTGPPSSAATKQPPAQAARGTTTAEHATAGCQRASVESTARGLTAAFCARAEDDSAAPASSEDRASQGGSSEVRCTQGRAAAAQHACGSRTGAKDGEEHTQAGCARANTDSAARCRQARGQADRAEAHTPGQGR